MSPTRRSSSLAIKPEEEDQDDGALDVLIIGAGWAGLAAAKELRNRGIDSIKILEGRDTYGGRCRSQVLADGISVAEHGAQWIHGASKSNPIYTLALEAGIALKRSAYAAQYTYQDQADGSCTRVSPERIDFMYDYLMEGKGGFYAYQEKRQEEDHHDVSLQQCAMDFLKKIHATEEQSAWLYAILDEEVTQEYSGSLEDMSMFWWDSDTDIPGGDCEMPGGFREILERYIQGMEHLLEYHSKVTHIDWTQKKVVTVHYTQNGQTKQVKAKRVVITVPLGVLQAKTIEFQPPLPVDKRRIINRIGMGLLNKCVFLWDEKDVDQLPWPQDREWLERIVAPNSDIPQGFFTEYYYLRPVTGRPLLCAFTAGRVAKELEDSTDQEIQQAALKALRHQFNGSYIPKPKQVIVTKWGKDEFALGSYSFNKVGGKHSDREKLAEPINKQLYFAGEACHSLYPGTTHGALLSGVHAAKQIVKASGKAGLLMAGMTAAQNALLGNSTKRAKAPAAR